GRGLVSRVACEPIGAHARALRCLERLANVSHRVARSRGVRDMFEQFGRPLPRTRNRIGGRSCRVARVPARDGCRASSRGLLGRLVVSDVFANALGREQKRGVRVDVARAALPLKMKVRTVASPRASYFADGL